MVVCGAVFLRFAWFFCHRLHKFSQIIWIVVVVCGAVFFALCLVFLPRIALIFNGLIALLGDVEFYSFS